MKVSALSTKIPNPISLKGILVLVLLEIFLGGGGRLIDIGPLSLRMYFFILVMALSIILIGFRQPINKNFLVTISIFTGLTFFSSIIGLINGASIGLILNDIKPLLSIYLIIFLYLAIRTEEDVLLIVNLIKLSAVVLSITYLILMLLIKFNIIPFPKFYGLVADTEEIFFRGEFAFFYKGFLYICVGLIFFATSEKINKPVIFVLVLSVILTFTRGFLVALMMTYLFYLIFIRKSALKVILLTFLLTIIAALLWEFIYAKMDRSSSDSTRIRQIEEVMNDVTPVSALIGHGFGIGVPSRPERMEIVFLEVFHKQGIMGLLFWALVMVLSWYLYRKALGNNSQLAVPFLLAVVLIYLESFTNPYLNNPIGLTMILVSLVCLNILGNKKV
jgi:hypothetical protein